MFLCQYVLHEHEVKKCSDKEIKYVFLNMHLFCHVTKKKGVSRNNAFIQLANGIILKLHMLDFFFYASAKNFVKYLL